MKRLLTRLRARARVIRAWIAERHAAGAARAAAWDAARAARDAQKRMFIDMCNGFAPWQEQPK